MGNFWEQKKNEIGYYLKTRDIANFQNWQPLLDTMIIKEDGFEYIRFEWDSIKDGERYINAGKESIKTLDHNFIHSEISNTSIHHLYHIYIYELLTKKYINKFENIIEFGAGYGNLCRLITNLGFTGTYNIYDLTELTQIQKYYLEQNLPKANLKNINYYTDICDLFNDANPKKCLFISTWGLTETEESTRNLFMEMDYSSIMIAYSHKFQNLDNLIYFNNLILQNKKYMWSHVEIPWLKGNNYIVR